MNEKSIIPSGGFSDPLKFKFGEDEIRVVRDEGSEPLFVAADICKAIEIVNVGNALARLDDDEKDDVRLMDVTGRMQNISVVTESGMYNLIIRSDKPTAKAFKRWITHEVLPQIRQTGSYIVEQKQPTAIQALRQIVDALEGLDNRVSSLEAHIQSEPDYFTVLGFFRNMGLKVPSTNEAQSIGIRASKLSEVKGYSMGRVSDPRYGYVKTYHISILNEVVKR